MPRYVEEPSLAIGEHMWLLQPQGDEPDVDRDGRHLTTTLLTTEDDVRAAEGSFREAVLGPRWAAARQQFANVSAVVISGVPDDADRDECNGCFARLSDRGPNLPVTFQRSSSANSNGMYMWLDAARLCYVFSDTLDFVVSTAQFENDDFFYEEFPAMDDGRMPVGADGPIAYRYFPEDDDTDNSPGLTADVTVVLLHGEEAQAAIRDQTAQSDATVAKSRASVAERTVRSTLHPLFTKTAEMS